MILLKVWGNGVTGDQVLAHTRAICLPELDKDFPAGHIWLSNGGSRGS
jgi:hypothetical protein